MPSTFFVRRSSVLREYSLWGALSLFRELAPLYPQIGILSDLRSMLEIWISWFRAPRTSFSRGGGHVPPRLLGQHATDKTEASEKIEVQAKWHSCLLLFLNSKAVFAFRLLILLGICQLDCNWGHFATRIAATCVETLCLKQSFESCTIFSMKRSKFVLAIQIAEAQWDLTLTWSRRIKRSRSNIELKLVWSRI